MEESGTLDLPEGLVAKHHLLFMVGGPSHIVSLPAKFPATHFTISKVMWTHCRQRLVVIVVPRDEPPIPGGPDPPFDRSTGSPSGGAIYVVKLVSKPSGLVRFSEECVGVELPLEQDMIVSSELLPYAFYANRAEEWAEGGRQQEKESCTDTDCEGESGWARNGPQHMACLTRAGEMRIYDLKNLALVASSPSGEETVPEKLLSYLVYCSGKLIGWLILVYASYACIIILSF